jgi:DNA-nicking Smr family endonuclease
MRDERDDEGPGDDAAQADDPTDGAAPLPLDGILDLHTFQPRDVKELVPAWLEACRDEGVLDVRIIHGKGIGVLRSIVQGILARHPAVESYGPAHDRGSWGATVARLRPRE